MGFNLQDYETVDSRIKKFYAEHEDGRLLTKLISFENNEAIVKAYLYLNDSLRATGYAHEVNDGKNYVNKTSVIENCETSAIGRALANFNYSGDKRASREEMEKVQRMENTDNARKSFLLEQIPILNSAKKLDRLTNDQKVKVMNHKTEPVEVLEKMYKVLKNLPDLES